MQSNSNNNLAPARNLEWVETDIEKTENDRLAMADGWIPSGVFRPIPPRSPLPTFAPLPTFGAALLAEAAKLKAAALLSEAVGLKKLHDDSGSAKPFLFTGYLTPEMADALRHEIEKRAQSMMAGRCGVPCLRAAGLIQPTVLDIDVGGAILAVIGAVAPYERAEMRTLPREFTHTDAMTEWETEILGPMAADVAAQFDEIGPGRYGKVKDELRERTLGYKAKDATRPPKDLPFDEIRRLLDAAASRATGAPDAKRMSDVVEVDLEWLWKFYVPTGAITIIEGDPDKGKSTALMDLIARLTTGRPFPGCVGWNDDTGAGWGVPVNVFILSSEDYYESVLKPRLRAARANQGRVFLMPDTIGDERVTVTSVEHFRKNMLSQDAKFLAIDPLTEYLPDNTNPISDPVVRAALRPLKAMIREMNAGAGIVRHLNKDASKSAMHRGSGTIATVALSRASFAVAEKPGTDKKDVIRVFAPTKHQYAAPGECPSWDFRIVKRDGDKMPHAEWIGPCDDTSDDILSASKPAAAPGKQADCEALLRKILAGGVSRKSSEVWDEVKKAGFTWATYQRARDAVRVVAENVGGTWTSRLP